MIDHKIRIGVLISGGGSNLQALMDSCDAGKLNGRIVFAGSDNPGAAGLARAREKGIPVFSVNYSDIIKGVRQGSITPPDDFDFNDSYSKQGLFGKDADPEKVRIFLESRAACESELLRHIFSYEFDVLALAGFMRTLSPYFIDRVNTDPFLPRIMNIHPALLPSFPGVDGYGDTFRYGCRVAGCTVHFVDYGEDSGPIIGQKSFQILPEDTLESVKSKGLEYEWQLYPECVQLFAEGRLTVVKEKYELKNGKAHERKIVRISNN
ncbi:phosphoribosylglycinamide formyltransferase [Desulforegula conservatrix]|uniref:phosphoribosylglycinamide formyltransferase n=1 Tax=Desulforegula conservatrix TaxID=153026 RepID=UPI0004277A7F